ncbi:hypothetical protein LIER_32207 [Lithospermum erythrorhizon]|uniref:Uncharacterized protein n=1 Tax=Lithospermum erythrorhizon TaxID=34254 RepID=A0AAV3RVE2_LITER
MSSSTLISGHRHNCVLTYVANRQLHLPSFFGGVDIDGNGPVVFCHAGEQYKVIVQNRILGIGWLRAELTSGMILH